MSKKSIRAKLATSMDELAKAELVNAISDTDRLEASLAIHYAIAIADVFCFADEFDNGPDEKTLAALGGLQSELLHKVKVIVSWGARP